MSVVSSNYYPSSNAQVSAGDVNFTNPANVYAADTVYATALLADTEITEVRRFATFDFTTANLPTGANIVGIIVYLRGYSDGSGGMKATINLYDATNGVSATSKIVYFGTVNTYLAMGNSTDMWGNTSISADDLRLSSFGLQFSVENVTGVSGTVYIDNIQIRVYYTVPPKLSATQVTTPTTGTAGVMTAPSGIVADGTLMLFVTTDNDSDNENEITLGSGGADFEKIFEYGDSSTDSRIAAFYKRRTDGTEGNITVNFATSCTAVGIYVRFEDAWTVGPIDGVGKPNLVASAAAGNTPTGLTSLSFNDGPMFLCFGGFPSSQTTNVTGTDWSKVTGGTNGTAITAVLGKKILDDNGPSGDPTMTITGSDVSVGIVLTLWSETSQSYSDYFPEKWKRKAKITIDSSKVSGSADLINFPMIITEKDMPVMAIDEDSPNDAYAGGFDFIFTTDSAGKNIIPHDVAVFIKNSDPTLATSVVWVQIPTLSYNTDTEIWIWWDPVTLIRTTVGGWHHKSTWQDYLFVSHDGSNDYGVHDFSFSDTGTVTAVEGLFGWSAGARSVPGSDDYVRCDPTGGGLDFLSDTWTIQAWANPDASRTSNMIACVQNPDSDPVYGGVASGFALMIASDGAYGVLVGPSETWRDNLTASVAYSAGWSLIHGKIVDGDVITDGEFYVNGVSDESVHIQNWNVSTMNDAFTFGANSLESSPTFDYAGIFSNIRVRKSGLSADWIATEYNNQKNDGTFMHVDLGRESAFMDQEAFRWRNDDGSEATATWIDSQDVNITDTKQENKRLRIITNITVRDPDTLTSTLQYRRVGDPDVSWRDVE